MVVVVHGDHDSEEAAEFGHVADDCPSPGPVALFLALLHLSRTGLRVLRLKAQLTVVDDRTVSTVLPPESS